MKQRNSEIEKNSVSESERANQQSHTQKLITFDDLIAKYYLDIYKYLASGGVGGRDPRGAGQERVIRGICRHVPC